MSHRHEATLGFFVPNRLFFGESDPVEWPESLARRHYDNVLVAWTHRSEG